MRKKSTTTIIPLVIGLLILISSGLYVMQERLEIPVAIGGSDTVIAYGEMRPGEQVRRLRTRQAVLSRREEMLRYTLSSTNNRHDRNALVTLLRDQKETEKRLVDFLKHMGESTSRIALSWPVSSDNGISAGFGDPEYTERFGLFHEAIDIPVLQGSEIVSAADGVVQMVIDNGLGFNYMIVRHDDFATLYGHVSKFLLEPGQEVAKGDTIALSGGTPGTPGAGTRTTGAHLHFEMISGGQKIDPLPYLPYSSTVATNRSVIPAT